MRVIQRFFFVMLISGLMAAQSTPPAETGASKLETDVQKLLDAVAAQQKAMADQQKQMAEQQKAMAEQQKRISEQEQEIAKLKQQLNAPAQPAAAAPEAQAAQMVNASLTVANTNPAMHTVSDMAQQKPNESPLSFHIGGADLTPGGFVDFENIFRSTSTGSAAATSFGAIPFSASVPGHETEFRTTGQYSRLNLRIDTTFNENKVRAYIEGDFNGNDAGNVFVGTNPHTARLRLYWLDLRRGRWEFLGGQSWGLLTPNRTGLSPMPSDLALTIGEDANVHVGVNHTRAGQFRAVFHPNDRFAWGFGIENPQQFVGNEVAFPVAFNGQLTTGSGQFDVNSAGGASGIPNAFPDVNTKFAYDNDLSGRHFHFEAGAMMTEVRITVLPMGVTGATFHSPKKTGGGVQAAVNYDILKNFRFISNVMWGNGIGRYLIGLAPQAVVVPINAAGATCTVGGNGCDATLSLVHAGNGTIGFEAQATPKTQLGFYYGGMYAQRNFFPDITAPGVTKPFAGFGGPGTQTGTTVITTNQNRAIQQGTIDWTQTFWRNPQYGAVLLVTQYSYLTRSTWFVSAGAPKNAHLSMGYLSVRYVLP